MSEKSENLTETADHPLSNRDPNNKKEWVKFEEEDEKTKSTKSESPPAVLTTESIHVTIESAPKSNQNGNEQKKTSQPAVINVGDSPGPVMRTVELSPTERIQEGFVNGEIIVTLLPVNVNWPWITPAVFRPELVPEELMAQGLSLTVEEYVNAMETLTTDYRFTLYNVCYKRVLLCWIVLAFCVLLGLLFSGITGVLLFSLGVAWLFLNATAIFLCMWVKLRLARGLEKCLARVNKLLIRHKIMVALDDRGNISCHKINLCFIYFDPGQCINYINNFLERSEQNGQAIGEGWESRLDIDTNDIIIQGSSNTRVSRKQAVAEQVYLRYLQRWGKDFLRHRLDWQSNANDDQSNRPRHLRTAFCSCQYTEEILKAKISKSERAKSSCCVWINQQMSRLGFNLC